MTSETMVDTGLDDLLNLHFAGKVVRKDLTKLVKEGANVPVFVLEYLLGSHCASNDEEMIQDGMKTVKNILAENYVRSDEGERVKMMIRERGSYKIIDKISVSLNEKRDVYEATLGNLGVKGCEINSSFVKKFEKLLAGGIWCIVTLQYFFEEGQKQSPFIIEDVKPIQMPGMDMEELFALRREFTETQWMVMSQLNFPSVSNGIFSAEWFRWSKTISMCVNSDQRELAKAISTKRLVHTRF